jgi:hypothetical protein
MLKPLNNLRALQQRLETLRVKLGIPLPDIANILGHPGGALGYVVLLDGEVPAHWRKLTPYYVFALRFLIHAWNVDGAKARGPKLVAMRNSYAAITFDSLGIEPTITTGIRCKKPARAQLPTCLMNQQAALNATDDPAMHAAIKQRMDLIVKATHPG